MQHSTTAQTPAQPQPKIFSVIRDGEGYRIYIAVPGCTGRVSKAHYIDALAAAEHAYWLVVHEPGNNLLSLANHIKDQLIANYQIEGARCYHRKSQRYVEPWNEYMVQGYEAARNDDKGLLVWGWPVPETVQANHSQTAVAA